jgi:hypothetical protein
MDEQKLTDMIEAAVQRAVKETVNGKIDKLTTRIESISNDEGTGKLDPVVSVIEAAQHIRSQLFVIITGILAVGGAIQAAQAIWSLVSPYIKFN